MSEHQIVFAIAPSPQGKILLLGVTRAAWDHMRDGKTHTFDLRKAGLDFQLLMFGGKNHTDIMGFIDRHNRGLGLATHDRRGEDFSVKTSPLSPKEAIDEAHAHLVRFLDEHGDALDAETLHDIHRAKAELERAT